MDTEIMDNLGEKAIFSGTKNDVQTQQSTKSTEAMSGEGVASPDGAARAGNLNIGKNQNQLKDDTKNMGGFPLKNKRRRRGKPKQKTNKPYKKSNWKLPMLKGRQSKDGLSLARKLARSRSIVPYNNNKFLMEEHMAEVPSALLTPSDEEEFLTKEFSNVYERARAERLEGMSKQQLIEECLQLEDRYSSGNGQANGTNEYLNKIRSLEERIREITNENLELRRKLEISNDSIERMLSSSSSEDSESDSSSSSSSSSCSSISCDNNFNMESDDLTATVMERNDTEALLIPNDTASEQQNQEIQPSRLCNGQAIDCYSRSPSAQQQIVANNPD